MNSSLSSLTLEDVQSMWFFFLIPVWPITGYGGFGIVFGIPTLCSTKSKKYYNYFQTAKQKGFWKQ